LPYLDSSCVGTGGKGKRGEFLAGKSGFLALSSAHAERPRSTPMGLP